ncbi:unnamed protein product [Cyberlindnera jadinii]|uniref:Uncharacterized protein n=1 Tax=Cyberlindnera jadinii (strain ATCC 18201 / CBS 1600 / BCRC 20928 / JCM 3617 / NBRC 0987 / NRRL Y-1542) TaxID=983966 RepID=A0A0H5C7H5_CYBJN|nr:unnamed protein product [Cyberlindnera jadinii]
MDVVLCCRVAILLLSMSRMHVRYSESESLVSDISAESDSNDNNGSSQVMVHCCSGKGKSDLNSTKLQEHFDIIGFWSKLLVDKSYCYQMMDRYLPLLNHILVVICKSDDT